MALIVFMSCLRPNNNSAYWSFSSRIRDIQEWIFFIRLAIYTNFLDRIFESIESKITRLKKRSPSIDTFRFRAFSSQSWILECRVSLNSFLGTSPRPLTGLTNGHPTSALRLYSSPSFLSVMLTQRDISVSLLSQRRGYQPLRERSSSLTKEINEFSNLPEIIISDFLGESYKCFDRSEYFFGKSSAWI